MSKADQFKALTRKKDEEREDNRETIKSGHVEIVTGLSQSASTVEKQTVEHNPEADEPISPGAQDILPSTDAEDGMVHEFLQRKERKLDNLIGIYVEDEVAKVLKKLNKKYGRGFQSRVVNEATRRFLKEQGWID